MAYVYRHIRLDKNEVFYIGISNSDDPFYKRANNFFHLHRKPHWNSIFNKSKIEVEIMFENVSYATAKEKEIEFISLYKRKCDGGTLVNITLGGDGVVGFKNAKLSERNKTGIWTGKKHTEETKRIMGNRSRGRKLPQSAKDTLSQKAKLRVGGTGNPRYKGRVQAFKDGSFIGEYESSVVASKELNCSLSNVCGVINGKRSNIKGFEFKRIVVG